MACAMDGRLCMPTSERVTISSRRVCGPHKSRECRGRPRWCYQGRCRDRRAGPARVHVGGAELGHTGRPDPIGTSTRETIGPGAPTCESWVTDCSGASSWADMCRSSARMSRIASVPDALVSCAACQQRSTDWGERGPPHRGQRTAIARPHRFTRGGRFSTTRF